METRTEKQDGLQTRRDGGEAVVLRYNLSNQLITLVGVVAVVLLFSYYNPAIPKGALWGGALTVLIIGVVVLIGTRRTIIFNDDGISVNGAAVIPWSKIDEVVVLFGKGADWYKFRYSSYDGKTRYLTIKDDMPNMQEAIEFAGKKLPGKFAGTFSHRQKSPLDVYTGGEIVMRDYLRSHVVFGFAFICVMWFLPVFEPEVFPSRYTWPVVLMFTLGGLFLMFKNRKVIFNGAGIIEKRNKPLIRWGKIYAVDIEGNTYVFRYRAHDGQEHCIHLSFNMTNMRKGIALAKKNLPNLFAE